METIKKEVFGFFISVSADGSWSDDEINYAHQKGADFRRYLYKESGFVDGLKKFEFAKYGDDLILILFQFYINPLPEEISSLGEIETYRKREKSIGIPIIISDENFFNKSELDRFLFLKESFIRKLQLLGEVVKEKKLDTNINKLIEDVKNGLQ